MPYRPQTTDMPHNQHPAARLGASHKPRRAPNDFLDYNHGPDSYAPGRRAPDARRWSSPSDERKPSQRP